MGLVVSVVPARAEVYLRRGIDTMWCRSSTQRPGRNVVCFVVLIVVALGDVRVLGTEVSSGPVLFHVPPPSMGARSARMQIELLGQGRPAAGRGCRSCGEAASPMSGTAASATPRRTTPIHDTGIVHRVQLRAPRLALNLFAGYPPSVSDQWLNDGLLVQLVLPDRHKRVCPAITSI